ncbi:nucleotidyltransferase family protein [Sulfurospirillum barnesii]|uniref:Putative nucleotidyltransferase n=1 Tax=Sulfurospirillum barnesii (strain ATCC 700032 / DSM 10660 / SES-3) TaxID=760154 RepID=I3XV59_SULBS|nr:nucleotidyltransferase family protein [Sulfurospirillum barnesii]AFL67833.1 putative nucleotidyltransferase [Sulfurospirillum barnesii SES-3]
MMTKTYILDFLASHKIELAQKYGVRKIGLFGSYARDEQREDSDIDIAVEIESNNKFRSFFSLKYFLEDAFRKKIDLGIESALKPMAKKYIDKEILYA